MENLFAQYSTNPSSSTTSTPISPSFSSLNVIISQQNADPFQINNIHLSNNSGHPFSFPLSPFSFHQGNFIPTGQSHVSLISPTTFQIQAQIEDGRKKIEATRGKIAREQKKQIIQKHRIVAATKAPEERIRRQRYQEIQHRTPHIFFTPDGKRLEEILTKKLSASDVNTVGRIVLPKRGAEKILPTPTREGITIVFKDICSALEWKVKFRYWINTKSRMYVLENTGDLVNHYKLCIGDYFSLYEDRSKIMYVYLKKACDLPTLELFPYRDQGKETEPVESINQQLSSNSMELQAPNQLVGQSTNKIMTSCVLDKTISMDGDSDDDDGVCGDGEQQYNLDIFYKSLGNICDIY
ncbi:B3 domain-containing transcription factor [Trifolium repens]|nr:B3 domain-containing transcription factor [Trifolium repens]